MYIAKNIISSIIVASTYEYNSLSDIIVLLKNKNPESQGLLVLFIKSNPN